MHVSTKTSIVLTLACLAVLAFYSMPTIACNCPYRSLQSIYCQADYVAVIGYWAKFFRLNKLHSYGINVYQTYKTSPEGNRTLESGILLTPPENTSCAVDLEYRKYYLIAGKGPELNSCDYVKNVHQLTNSEKRMFRGDYRSYCN